MGSDIMEQQTTVTTLAQLYENTLFQILNLKHDIGIHLNAVRQQRLDHPNSEPYIITEKVIKQLGQNFIEIKEQGIKIDQNSFTDVDSKAIALLKKLRIPVQFRREDIFSDLETILHDLEQIIKIKIK
jgi:hypothetical protein